MSLPLPAVDRLFDRLTATYGRQFISLYEGLDSAAVKTIWAHELAGYTTRLQDIAWALENLPDDAPPLLGQFKAVVGRAPELPQRKIEAPKPDPVRVAVELSRMRAATAERDRLQWAYDLQERESRGDRLTPGQRTAWRDALASVTAEPQAQDQFNPIPVDALPPAMRLSRMAA